MASSLPNGSREETISSGTIPPAARLDPNKLEPDFMYCQLLKEKFLKIRYDKISKDEFIDYCRSRGDNEVFKKADLEEFEQTYGKGLQGYSPIWWYTKESFLYRVLNAALRTLDMEILMRINFYIRDLHEQIHQRFLDNKDPLPPVVYRRQILSRPDWEKLKSNVGGLHYFNNFLSTTKKREKALVFASNGSKTMVGILFVIKMDRSQTSVPFTYVEDITAMKGEYEVLFSIGSVFHVEHVEEIESDLWQVNLSTCSDRDPTLTRLMDHIRRSLGEGSEWRQLAQLMIKMGHYQKGKEIFVQLGRQASDPLELMFLHNQMGHCEKQLANLHEALEHYQKVLTISRQLSLSSFDPRLSSTYSNIGAIWKQLRNFDEALKYFQHVLKIDENAEKSNRLEIAVDYNNIGSVLDEQGKYTEALEYYQKSLEIKCVHFPTTHPSLATSYLNIGSVYRKIGHSPQALTCYEKALDIQKRSLPPNHPSFISTYGNMAIIYEKLAQYEQAIQCAEEAAKMAKLAFGTSHAETRRREAMLQILRENRQ